jgi:hypothetical protein
MEEIKFRVRKGSVHGAKHKNLHVNNQDAMLVENFSISTFKKEYRVGLVSDGCTGNPIFSHNEVGANLLTVFAYRRIQDFICAGANIAEVPKVLFLSITEFIGSLVNQIMPSSVYWPYPVKLKDREGWSSATRFRNDYLAATLLGFITDGVDCVIFSAGDGIIMINDELEIIDQNDQPDYPAVSVNQVGKGFAVKQRPLAEINRLIISTDGLDDGTAPLIKEKDFREKMFNHLPGNPFGLQCLLNIYSEQFPEKMKDDCTAVTLEKI